jgi:MoaA/NifB/PqqE/SkfB family radical SAM enzyme
VTNLAISTVCNQNCPYCFTLDYLSTSETRRHFLDLDDFEMLLNFLERSRMEEIRLLGGEPTLHPQFVALIERASETGKRIVIFSNGLMSEEILSCLESLPSTNCTILVNVNESRTVADNIQQQQNTAIRRLGKRVLLGFNIYQTDFQLDFLLPIIAGTGCKPAIRLGMAQPCLSGKNQYIHPNQYVAVGKKITHFANVAAEAGVRLEFDCGFVRCMFSDADLETLKALGTDVGWRCNPILDITVEGQAIHCYPLAELGSLPLTPETDASALRGVFETRTHPYRQAGVFKECSTCPFKISGECPGGCLAATIRRFRHTSFRLAIPDRELAI